ncbi:hypothetical protein PENANT_c003G11092 [Penicillium antarcticum]|uniref:Uncharacterized protein n=1 Tax=Penicillium antarcticum TaxID=416450 RepID=A0A1V6QI98_9EURO|nr:hypothetical protein PENANT_c003G11092 [Penicillium antarcticum]
MVSIKYHSAISAAPLPPSAELKSWNSQDNDNINDEDVAHVYLTFAGLNSDFKIKFDDA